jgi:hypothetical protein
MNCAGATGWKSARSLSRVARCMRASKRRSHHSSTPGAVNAPRIALPSASSCSKATCTPAASRAERRAERRGADRTEQLEPPAQQLAQRSVALGASARTAAIGGTSVAAGTPPAARAAARRRRQRSPDRCDAAWPRAAARAPRRTRAGRLAVGEEAVHAQRVVQLVGDVDLGPCVLAHLRDHLRVERPMSCAVCRSISAWCARSWCAAPRPRRRRGRHTAAR